MPVLKPFVLPTESNNWLVPLLHEQENQNGVVTSWLKSFVVCSVLLRQHWSVTDRMMIAYTALSCSVVKILLMWNCRMWKTLVVYMSYLMMFWWCIYFGSYVAVDHPLFI